MTLGKKGDVFLLRVIASNTEYKRLATYGSAGSSAEPNKLHFADRNNLKRYGAN